MWDELEPIESRAARTQPTLPASAPVDIVDIQAPSLPAPTGRLGHFQVIREIGQGATGRVFLAHDPRLGRDVALKLALRQDAASRARFEREARAVARLQHANIVAIFDVVEHHGQPCIVEEYVDGGSLAAHPRPIPWQRALVLGMALADALAAAHDSGVLHRDIKPANVMVTSAGVPKLVDFGLAKLTGEGDTVPRLAGTPYYMAPELWHEGEATPSSDVYSLGVLLHELCTGRVPHHDVPADELPRVAAERDALLIARALADTAGPAESLERRFAAVIERCLAREPTARFASGKELYAALAAIASQGANSIFRAENPYPGLRPFDRDHSAYFFGRDMDIRNVAAQLAREHLVLIAGESGVGKSSLVRAGVLPWIAERGLEGMNTWWTCTMLPGQHALMALSTALSPRLGMDASTLHAALVHDLAEVGRGLQRVQGAGAGTIIVVDQLEQLVTLCAHEDAAAMAAALAYLVSCVPRLRILATVRGDKLTRLVHLPGLGPRIERALYILRPLDPHQVREAVVRPAHAWGARFESAAMVDALASDAVRASGGLPLLQFALSQLWEHRDTERGIIPEAALVHIGGLAGALARHADRVVDGLRSERAAREVLMRLVLLHEMRARHTEEALLTGDETGDRRKALEALVQGRLVVASETDAAPVYEIAHEALLTGWPRLQHWLDEESHQQALQRRLAFAAAEWERLGRSREALWQERRLRETEGMDPDLLGPAEAAFLQHSRRLVQRARWMRRLVLLAPFLLLGVACGVFRYDQERRQNAEVDALLHQAAPLVEHAQARSRAYRHARSNTVAYARAGAFAAAQASWQEALALAPEAESALAKASRHLEQALAHAPARRDVRERIAAILYEQARLAEDVAEGTGQPAALERLLERLASYDDTGAFRARWEAPRTVTLTTTPPSLPVTLYRYDRQPNNRLTATALGRTHATPPGIPHVWQLAPGSYLLVVGPDRDGQAVEVRYPFRVMSDRAPNAAPLPLHIDVPARSQVPDGFVYIPAGSFLFGYGGDDTLEPMRDWYKTTPPHERNTTGFLIARHETTYEQWIAFLRALPAGERAAHMPGEEFDTTRVALLEQNGELMLTFRAVARTYEAMIDQPIIYQERDRRRSQNWLRFPVTGISGDDAQAYVRWLDRTGQVPNARLCHEDEWERAARGADARLYPHGYRLAPDDANFDATYGKKDGAYGFDEVGSHPASQSPFGVDDLAGNARELTISILDRAMLAVRGGDFFRSPRTSAVVNREVVTSAQRIPFIGLRVCADLPSRR